MKLLFCRTYSRNYYLRGGGKPGAYTRCKQGTIALQTEFRVFRKVIHWERPFQNRNFGLNRGIGCNTDTRACGNIIFNKTN